MKAHTLFAIAGLLCSMVPRPSVSQEATPPDEVQFSKKSLGGPRLGFTYIPGNSELAQRVKDQGMNPIISQFGWHFEHRVIANGMGPAFIIEFIPLLGAVEYGKPILSLSLMFGIRMPSGYEFGVGPNVIVAPNINSGLIIALGKTFDVQGVSIPVNIAWATSPVGGRLAFIVGYAI